MFRHVSNIILLILLLFFHNKQKGNAQQLNHTLHRDYSWGFEGYFNNKDDSTITFIKPYRIVNLKKVNDSDITFPALFKTKEREIKHFDIELLPLFTTQAGYQITNNNLFTYHQAIGANLQGNVGNKFSFQLKGLTGQAIFNNAVDSIIRSTSVIPGLGYAYKANNDSLNGAYSYQYYSGYLSYSPNKTFNFQVGKDKHFWGDGYRSLFISDVAAPYPFLKISANVWKLTYVNLYTVMKDATNPSGLKKDWMNKYATFHYLGINISKRIHFGVFESIVWQGTDSNRSRGYDVNYLSPVIFFRPVEYSLGSSDNALLGASIKIKLFKKQQLYGQVLLDEFYLKELIERTGWWANKYGFQAGLKSFDLFKIKQLNFQTEFNYVRPYTYSHGSAQQNYGHMNQPLAHPLGANFIESATFINYRFKRIFLEAKATHAIYGSDSASGNFGKNIFVSYTKRPYEYNNKVMQGIKTTLSHLSLRAAYIVDPDLNFKIEGGVLYRIEQSNYYGKKQMPYVFVGICTDLSNIYSDY